VNTVGGILPADQNLNIMIALEARHRFIIELIYIFVC
jgi:hypothetical protein